MFSTHALVYPSPRFCRQLRPRGLRYAKEATDKHYSINLMYSSAALKIPWLCVENNSGAADPP